MDNQHFLLSCQAKIALLGPDSHYSFLLAIISFLPSFPPLVFPPSRGSISSPLPPNPTRVDYFLYHYQQSLLFFHYFFFFQPFFHSQLSFFNLVLSTSHLPNFFPHVFFFLFFLVSLLLVSSLKQPHMLLQELFLLPKSMQDHF